MLWTPPIWWGMWIKTNTLQLVFKMGFSEIVWESQGMWLLWRREKQQRRSGVVLIRRLLQRCGLGRGARTSREKQHWRLQGLPSAATAYPRMPLSPSPRGTAGPTEHLRKQSPVASLPFFWLPGETGKANRPGRCLFGRQLCLSLWRVAKWSVTFDIVHADASHPKERNETVGRVRAFNPLWTGCAKDVFVVYTEKLINKVSFASGTTVWNTELVRLVIVRDKNLRNQAPKSWTFTRHRGFN